MVCGKLWWQKILYYTKAAPLGAAKQLSARLPRSGQYHQGNKQLALSITWKMKMHCRQTTQKRNQKQTKKNSPKMLLCMPPRESNPSSRSRFQNDIITKTSDMSRWHRSIESIVLCHKISTSRSLTLETANAAFSTAGRRLTQTLAVRMGVSPQLSPGRVTAAIMECQQSAPSKLPTHTGQPAV